MVNIEVDGTDYPVPSSAADTNWAAKQVAFEQAVVTYIDDTATDLAELETSVDTVTWSNLSLLNSWANVGGGSINAASSLHNGIVYVRGFIQDGAAGTVCATLPSGRRPPGTMGFVCGILDGNDVVKVTVAASGDITIFDAIGGSGGDVANGVYLSLSFSIAANP